MLNLSPGLMVWTLITFGIAVFVLWRYAFGPLQKIIDQRRATVQESMDAAEQTRAEAQRLLEEYKETLAKVRAEAEEILERSRKDGRARARPRSSTRRARQAQRMLDQGARADRARHARGAARPQGQIAELTALATERSPTRQLDDGRPGRLIDEALAELPTSTSSAGDQGGERRAGRTGLRAGPVRRRASRRTRSRRRAASWATSSRALAASAAAARRAGRPADRARPPRRAWSSSSRATAQPLVANMLQLLLDSAAASRVVDGAAARQYEALAATEAAVVNVEVTSAVELDRRDQQEDRRAGRTATGRRVELTQRVDPAILGGLVLRVDDVIVDGSVRARIQPAAPPTGNGRT